ncbi:hypothetical protein IUY40_17130 [Flavobacterium sp. ALJ2]|uniref:hypothetical protein n=1 Tax=Flavobacterium sp. ALJ2 TaxID=2786960 RepID=UPI00189C8D7A|nr:hypothetical protein [Flavobacterium sp. ALJ2]MBF7093259.1 hypothetical protein [Flavobacterium sp. ALJ2]
MNKEINYIQDQWRKELLPKTDCILFKNGKVIIANIYKLQEPNSKKSKQYWIPLCDTTIDSLEKYESDIWTTVNIFHGAINHGDEIIVFGDGSMGHEGFIASTNKNGDLNWAIFFTFSNPIFSAEIKNDELICISELETKITIQLKDLTKISIETKY